MHGTGKVNSSRETNKSVWQLNYRKCTIITAIKIAVRNCGQFPLLVKLLFKLTEKSGLTDNASATPVHQESIYTNRKV